MANQFQDNELHSLILRMIEGDFAEEDFIQLNNIFRETRSSRDTYAEFVILYSMLKRPGVLYEDNADVADTAFNASLWEVLADEEKTAAVVQLPKPESQEDLIQERYQDIHRKASKASIISIAVSMAALIFIILFAYLAPPRKDTFVGTLARTVDARWEDVQLAAGDDLHAGPLKLSKGLAEVTLDPGTTIVLEAPVSMELVSPSQVFLRKGRIVAKVHNGSGDRFFVQTVNSTIVDFGTEFGVEVDSDGQTQTYVFQGQVKLRGGSDPLKFSESLTLKKGDGGRVGSRGIEKVSLPPGQFICEQDFDNHIKARNGSRYHQWLLYKQHLCSDSDLVLYYTFEKESQRPDRVANQASSQGSPSGQLVSFGKSGTLPRWVPGRVPGKTALQFSRDQQAAVRVPADPSFCLSGPISIVAWVYLPDPVRKGGHLILCRNDLSDVNFQFSFFDDQYVPNQKNQMEFLRYYGSYGMNGCYSKPVDIPSRKWIQAAVTYDGHIANFYMDGELHDSAAYECNGSPALADLYIGKLYPLGKLQRGGEALYESGTFEGVLDELMIYQKALNNEEIKQLYIEGKAPIEDRQ